VRSVTTVPGRSVLRDRRDRTVSYHRIFLSHPDMWKSKSDADRLGVFKSMYWMPACGHAVCASLLPSQLNPLIHRTFIMSAQLAYQECYHQLAHESVINTMVLSPEGRRLVTPSQKSGLRGRSVSIIDALRPGEKKDNDFRIENEGHRMRAIGNEI
jgi:hypothetical protein